MNVLHMKYVVEVAQSGSLNKASEKLLIAPPNLSRCIKELEADLGIRVFDRTNKGMKLTPEGEEFILYARNILKQIDALEDLYKSDGQQKQRFSVSVPRASYISDSFARFSTQLADTPSELFYKETNSIRAIKNVLSDDYKLGIIRYASIYDRQFKQMLDEKGLIYEMIAEFHYVLVMNAKSPLLEKETISFADLEPLIEIAHGDPYVPSLPLAAVRKEELPNEVKRRICVFERASQFDLLCENPQTYMWVSPIPEAILERLDLRQKPCADNKKLYKDVLIYRKDYRLSPLDKLFITEVCNSRRNCFA